VCEGGRRESVKVREKDFTRQFISVKYFSGRKGALEGFLFIAEKNLADKKRKKPNDKFS